MFIPDIKTVIVLVVCESEQTEKYFFSCQWKWYNSSMNEIPFYKGNISVEKIIHFVTKLKIRSSDDDKTDKS